MSGKSGPGVPKNLRKVTPGYDQAFTLPKGTSAAPIKQVATNIGKNISSYAREGVKAKDVKTLHQAEKSIAYKKEAKKQIKYDKKKEKKKLQPIKDFGKGTAIGTVVASGVQGNRNDKRP